MRRWLYDTADSVRLAALWRAPASRRSADVVAKIRREERYHLMHLDTWLRRLAAHDGPRDRVTGALDTLSVDAMTVFTPIAAEGLLVQSGVLGASMAELATRWPSEVNAVLRPLGLPAIAESGPPADGRDHSQPTESFTLLWEQFTSVARLEEGVEW